MYIVIEQRISPYVDRLDDCSVIGAFDDRNSAVEFAETSARLAVEQLTDETGDTHRLEFSSQSEFSVYESDTEVRNYTVKEARVRKDRTS